MRKRRVFLLMCLLKPEERLLFKEFLQSPLFAGSKASLQFFELWEKRLLDSDVADVSVEDLLAGSRFQVNRFDKLCSKLYQHLLDFMGVLEYKNSTATKLTMVQQALVQRDAANWDQSRHANRFSRWIGQQDASAQRSFLHFQLELNLAEQKISRRETEEMWREDLQLLHQLLDRYYVLQKLRLVSASTNLRLMYQQPGEVPDTTWKRFMEDMDLEEATALEKTYFYTIQLLSSGEGASHFENLMELLETHGTAFGDSEARELYNYVLNHTIRKGNQGNAVYWEYTGRLYQDLLAKDLLLVDGRLPTQAMKNIVVLHCKLGNLAWVEGFIEAYQHRLSLSADPMMATYNRSVLAYFKEDYRTCITGMREVIHNLKDDIFYELDARVYLWKSWYNFYDHLSFEEVDEMERLYDSFRILIDRNQKVSNSHKLQYRNFIRIFKRLMVLSQVQAKSADQLEELKLDILNAPQLHNRDWLLDQVENAF